MKRARSAGLPLRAGQRYTSLSASNALTMLRFRLFGIDVQVQFFFLVIALLISVSHLGGVPTMSGAVVVLPYMFVVFLAVLSHELGHAFVMSRYRLDPGIILHGMGGTTYPSTRAPLTRPQHVIISLAGPFAGFLQAAILFGFFALAPGLAARLPVIVTNCLFFMIQIDVYWGVFNLIPVLPLDGGHVLEHALGPKRTRWTAGISLVIAVGVIAASLVKGEYFIAMIFGLSGMQSYQRLRDEPAVRTSRATPVTPPADDVPPEAAALLQSARHAVAEDQTDRAVTLARRVLEGDDGSFRPTPRARVLAFEIVAWARLHAGDIPGASDAVSEASRAGQPDASLVGAVLLARGDTKEARKVLEAARARGETGREIVGPLIQALLAEGDVARAAAAALDITDQLSDDDVRKMAGLAFDGAAFEGAARLSEVLFARTHQANDAYDAARALAKDGEADRALDMLRRAVEAGFSDRARAWSDAALEALRGGRLDDVVPRP